MKQMEKFESNRSLEIVSVSELVKNLDSEETAILVPYIDFAELQPDDEMIWQGGRLSYYIRVNEISEAGKPRIEKHTLQSRRNLDAVRGIINESYYALLGSCSGIDDYGSATDPELDVLRCDKRAWLLEDQGSQVKETVTGAAIERIALLN